MDIKIHILGRECRTANKMGFYNVKLWAHEVEQVQFYVLNLEKYRTRITMWFHDNNTKKFLLDFPFFQFLVKY